jgi:SAM-dependent methyltransferase
MSLFQIDDSRMPLRLGSALRVPSSAYAEWGILPDAHRIESDEAYKSEWEGGSPRQMEYVIDASKRADLGNYPQMLRDANARVVAAAVRQYPGKVHILEPGFGVSTVNMFDALDDNDKDRVVVTGIEPSEERGEKALADLVKRGLVIDENLYYYPGVDNHMLDYVGPDSQHIIRTVAQWHHHAYLDTPFAVACKALKDGGIFTSSDWHNSMWEHPARVYRFLQTLEWETKEDDLLKFNISYPMAHGTPPEDPLNDASNENIRRFWRSWVEVRREAIEREEFDPRDDILMLEGHRPVERYIEEMERAGFWVPSPFIAEIHQEAFSSPDNPYQHLEDARILMTITCRKNAK